MAVTDRAETNENFARHNDQFRAACERAGVQPTKRQASRFRRHTGAAYRADQELRHFVEAEVAFGQRAAQPSNSGEGA